MKLVFLINWRTTLRHWFIFTIWRTTLRRWFFYNMTYDITQFEGLSEPCMYRLCNSRWYGGWPAEMTVYALHIYKVGQNHIYTVFLRYFWQENHQIYGHIRCIYTVLANPTHIWMKLCFRIQARWLDKMSWISIGYRSAKMLKVAEGRSLQRVVAQPPLLGKSLSKVNDSLQRYQAYDKLL